MISASMFCGFVIFPIDFMGKRLCFKEKSLLMVRICLDWVVMLAQIKNATFTFFHFFPFLHILSKEMEKMGV